MLKNIYAWRKFRRRSMKRNELNFSKHGPTPRHLCTARRPGSGCHGGQETRDLIRILVDLFKNRGEKSPVITAADFDITNEKGSSISLLSSVTNQLHRTLLEKARRNLEAVSTAVRDPATNVPHAAEIISALWLRSLSVEKVNGAEPAELQGDITRGQAIDDNTFAAEMALIRENSFNIHPVGNRLVFKEEENAEGKLLAHAKNDKIV